MAKTLTCSRCHLEAEPLDSSPLPGPLGLEVEQRVCPACWAEWLSMEIMVINELKLNFMDPAAQQLLDQQMREFLGFEPAVGEVT